ncbi:MAG: transglutaminase-like domain-containing protein, partial [Oscillospiraceae bacterium]|nr:transglutaminase-like domain-containing protein [Oscillospiraceae bacterium]
DDGERRRRTAQNGGGRPRGIVPNHGFALSLVAFWFTMMAVQMASSGVTHSSKTGFLRRKNVFFPVSSMRFMLPETIGISVLCMVLALLLFSECILKITDYTRPEQIKTWRSDFQDYVSSLEFASKLPGNFGDSSEIYDENQELIELGALDERIYQDTPVTSVSFSDNPHSRIYLKYRTGHVYTGTNWTILPEDVYNQNTGISSIFRNFENLDYYPEEFLYDTAPGLREMKLTFSDATEVIKKCVPYGFQKNGKITCYQDMITTETDTYLINSGADYELIFSNPNMVTSVRMADLWTYYTEKYGNSQILNGALAYPDKQIWMKKNYQTARSSKRIQQAGLLSGQYSQFLIDHEIALPNNQAMKTIRTVYADLFTDFDATRATPAETIQKLQEIRNRICQSVSYTLSPGKTPANQDHVAYFLLENMQGYCEHYATAGTILARMAGIPARYCEGYMLDCSQPGILQKTESESGEISFDAEILDSNAHAWTEIYLNGIGWIPFEFTFSYFSDSMIAITEVPESELAESTESMMTTAPDFAEITEFSENLSENSLENTSGDLSGDLTETNFRKLSGKWIVILSVLILAAFFCLTTLIFRIARLLSLRRRADAFTQDDLRAASQAVYAYLTELLTECGVHAHSVTIGELIEESEALCHEFMNSEQYSLSIAIQLGAKLRYSPHPLSNGERHYLQHTADALAQGMYENAKFPRRFYLRWLRHYL